VILIFAGWIEEKRREGEENETVRTKRAR